MDTLFNVGMLKRTSIIAALGFALTACGGGGGGAAAVAPAPAPVAEASASLPLDEQVFNLFAQVDAGTLSEEELISQLRALGF